MRHMNPCCDNGWRETKDESVQPESKLSTDLGMIELLGIAYRHDNGALTVVPFDDPYLGDLGRQSLLMIHQHICTEVERMQKTPPPAPPRPEIRTTDPDPVMGEIEKEALQDGHIRLYFGLKDDGEYYEYFLIGGIGYPLGREGMVRYVRAYGPVTKLFINDKDETDDIPRFLHIIRGKEFSVNTKPFMGDEFRPSKN